MSKDQVPSSGESLESEIAKVYVTMDYTLPGTEEYKELLADLDKLSHIRREDNSREDKLSVNTIAIIAANLIGILAVAVLDRNRAFNSRALNQVMKLRFME